MSKLIVFGLFAVLARGAELKCGGCHTAESRDQQTSAMAHALQTPGANATLAGHPKLQVQKGIYTYTLETKGTTTTYSVSDGTQSLSAPIHWAFGAHSQTYVYEIQGQWYESLMTYFAQIDGLDTTIGDAGIRPKTLADALGRPIDEKEREACFGCHSSDGLTTGKLDLSSAIPGVTCDHCHANALQHQAAILKGSLANLPPKLKGNSAFNIANFCGQCHRTWETVMRMPPVGVADVRFQPYRLMNSKCFVGSDARISCVACHNPHAASTPTAAKVTAACVSCHSVAEHAKVCPVSKTDCASCHMPKVELPGSHRLFTDHDIRIVKAGESFPY